MNHKLLIKFQNTEYHKIVFAYWANKLYLLNIYIQHIPRFKNFVADSLSWVIVNNADCSPNWLVSKLAKEFILYSDNNK